MPQSNAHHPASPQRTSPAAGLSRTIRAALLLSAASPWLALTAAHAASAADSTAADLTEVVVTATRRASSMLDIPYSISAVSSASLEQEHVRSLADLTRVIAGVAFVDQGPTSRSNFVLRGINANATNNPSTNTVAPVSTYIGETPLFLSLHIDDLDRVEVLRGPQGTLYGSGSLAGTIRLIPKKPDPHGFSASVEGDVADVAQTAQNNRAFSGVLNLPLSETAALRFSAGYQHYAGFINEHYIIKTGDPSTAQNSPVGIPVSADPHNPLFGPLSFSPVRGANTADLWQTRAALLLTPSERLSILLSYYHQDDKTQGQQAISPNFSGAVDYAPADNPFYSPDYPVQYPTGGVVFPKNGPYDVNNSVLLQNHRRADLGTADISYDVGFATLSSSTSYYRDRGNDVADGTSFIATHPSFYGFLPRALDYETEYDALQGLVEEVRLVSSGTHRLDYVAGLFYQHLQGNNGQTQWVPGQTFYSNLATGYPGSSADTYGDTNFIVANTTDFKDRALFGELTLHATDQWQVTGGMRFFKQDFSTLSYSALPYCGSYCGSGAAGVTLVPANGYAVNDHIIKLNSAYKFNSGLNAYLNYAEGFRRGGANGIPLAGPFAVNPALQVYTPDKTKNYEIGLKGRTAAFNYALDYFLIDWNSFQLDTQSYAGGYSLAANGVKARSQGVEASVDGELAQHWNYQLSYTYTKARVAQDFAILDNLDDGSGGSAAIVTGKSGDALPNAPQHSATFGLTYTTAAPAFLAGWTQRWHLNGSYRSATLSRLVNTAPGAREPFNIAGFSLWDASVDLSSRGGLYTSLYAQNLFNQLGITGGLDAGEVAPGNGGVRHSHYFVGRPRTIGLRIGYKF